VGKSVINLPRRHHLGGDGSAHSIEDEFHAGYKTHGGEAAEHLLHPMRHNLRLRVVRGPTKFGQHPKNIRHKKRSLNLTDFTLPISQHEYGTQERRIGIDFGVKTKLRCVLSKTGADEGGTTSGVVASTQNTKLARRTRWGVDQIATFALFGARHLFTIFLKARDNC
jgi:hypothetical protein